MALNAAGIATAIAALPISGVTVLDISAVPETGDLRQVPVLFPNPSNWIAGGIGGLGEGPATFGPGMWLFQRAFSYLYLHAPVGSGRALSDHMRGMSVNLDAILTALTTLDVAGVDVLEIDNSDFNVITDPAGAQWYGFQVTVAMEEKINA